MAARIVSAWPRRRPRSSGHRPALGVRAGRGEPLGVAPRRLAPAEDELHDRHVVERPGELGVVHGGVEARGQLLRDLHAVEEDVDLVVVGLAARAVRLDEPDRGVHERQVAVDVGVHPSRRSPEPFTERSSAALKAIRQACGTLDVRPACQLS